MQMDAVAQALETKRFQDVGKFFLDPRIERLPAMAHPAAGQLLGCCVPGVLSVARSVLFPPAIMTFPPL